MKKILIIILVIVASGALAFTGRLIYMAKASSTQSPESIGLENGHLKACGKKPNCVSSRADKNSQFYIEPLKADNVEVLWDDLHMALKEMGFEEKTSQAYYIHATAKTKLLGFTDDMEFLINAEEQVIEMRSQSRVGYSDMGANRKRLEAIRSYLYPKQ